MSWAKRILSEGGWSNITGSSGPTQFGRVNFSLFFDRNAIISRLDKFEHKVLSRTGAFGRQVIRQSIRTGGKNGKRSGPGQPPRFHKRGFARLKDGIFFQADLDRGSVVIGPNKLITKTIPKGGLASGAQLLEEGGRATTLMYKHRSVPRVGQRLWVDMVMQARPFVHKQRDKIAAEKLKIIAKVGL